jgi:hypothetical protein
MTSADDLDGMMRLLHHFLSTQRGALKALQSQFPEEKIDLYQGSMEELFANLDVLMYYRITAPRLDTLLRLFKAAPESRLFVEEGLEPDTFSRIMGNLEVLLYKHGQMRSFRAAMPVDSEDRPVPWMTYPAMEYLAQFDYTASRVLEIGAGNSTLYWAARSAQVVSLETDPAWYASLLPAAPPNVSLQHVVDAQALNAAIASQSGKFDVIVIDSARFRFDAVAATERRIASGGFVVFDNSDWYPESCKRLGATGLIQVDFHGFGPMNGYAWTTSVFLNGNPKFRRFEESLHPIGGRNADLDDDRSQMECPS